MTKNLLLLAVLAGQTFLMSPGITAGTRVQGMPITHDCTLTGTPAPQLRLHRAADANDEEQGTMLPLNVRTSENGTGKGTLLWDAPEGSDAGNLAYNVYIGLDEDGYPIQAATGVKGNSYGFTYPPSGDQAMLYVGVSAVKDGQEGDISFGPVLVTGTPYTMPFFETFPGEHVTYPMWHVSSKGATWKFNISFDSADDAGGCVKFMTYDEDDWSELTSGKISLAGVLNPVLEFDLLERGTYDNKTAKLTVMVYNPLTGNNIPLQTFEFNESMEYNWRHITLPLEGLEDCLYTAIVFRGECNEFNDGIALDRISVNYTLDHDLAITGTAPDKVKGGSVIPLKVQVSNKGAQPAKKYTASLYDGDELLETLDGQELQPGQSEALTFNYLTPVNSNGYVTPEVRLDYLYDMEPDNDCARFRIGVGKSDMPGVRDLSISCDGTISWTAPETSGLRFTEDFEQYRPWSIADLGQWQLLDLDGGSQTGFGYQGKSMPHTGEPFAWIVWNPTDFELDLEEYPGFRPHSGNQFIAAFNVSNYWLTPDGHNNDWIISPELSGNAQEISFFVAKYLDNYGKEEKFEVLWSDGSTLPSDFVSVGTGEVPAQKWTEMKYRLPEGARRFAIRYIGEGQYYMAIDDISYEPAIAAIKGYNIYRNGEPVAFTETPGYKAQSEAGDIYNVTVRYENAESDFSEGLLLRTSGIDSAEASGADSNVTYHYLNGLKAADGDAYDSLPRGIYIKKDHNSGKVTKIVKK